MKMITVSMPKDQWEAVVKAIEVACNKPEPKPNVVCFSDVRYEKDYEEIEWQENETEYMSNLKLTFDGETGELKSAEVLK